MKLITVLVAAIAAFVAVPAHAEAPRTTTTWYFRVETADGKFAESTDPNDSGTIPTPPGFGWTCERKAVMMRPGDVLVGGFLCSTSTGQFMAIRAACYKSKEDKDLARATIGDLKGLMMFTAICSTVVNTPPPPQGSSIERSL